MGHMSPGDANAVRLIDDSHLRKSAAFVTASGMERIVASP